MSHFEGGRAYEAVGRAVGTIRHRQSESVPSDLCGLSTGHDKPAVARLTQGDEAAAEVEAAEDETECRPEAAAALTAFRSMLTSRCPP
jgi:hypothetical protein